MQQTLGASPSRSTRAPRRFQWGPAFDRLRQQSEERLGSAQNPILVEDTDEEDDMDLEIAPPTPATLTHRASLTPFPDEEEINPRISTSPLFTTAPLRPLLQHAPTSTPARPSIVVDNAPRDGISYATSEPANTTLPSPNTTDALSAAKPGPHPVDDSQASKSFSPSASLSLAGVRKRKEYAAEVKYLPFAYHKASKSTSVEATAEETFTRVSTSSEAPLTSPALMPKVSLAPGDVYWHAHPAGHQYWIRQLDATWRLSDIGAPHPTQPRRCLAHNSPGVGKLKGRGPVWVLRSSFVLTQRRRAQRAAAATHAIADPVQT